MIVIPHNQCLQHFLAERERIVATLARAFEEKLRSMGDDVRQITWFSIQARLNSDRLQKKAA